MHPERLGAATRALYSLLEDGEPHRMDEVLYTINRSVSLQDAVHYKSGKSTSGDLQKRTAQGVKEKTRITLLVAKRQGHIRIEDERVTMMPESREMWLSQARPRE